MLSPSKRSQIKEILERVANGQSVSLGERILIQKFADKDQSVNTWLTRARRIQQDDHKKDDGLDELLENLDLGSSEPNSHFNADQEDLGDWFIGAPSWLSRS